MVHALLRQIGHKGSVDSRAKGEFVKFTKKLMKKTKQGYRNFLQRLTDDELVDIKNYP
jgi:type III secretory pathway component EscR